MASNSSQQRSVLVTGSSGFLGGHLVARRVADGYRVTGLDNAEPRQPLPPGVTDIRADVRDRSAIYSAVADAAPSIVFHCAAQASVAISMREPIEDIRVNVIGSVRLAEAAAQAGVERFVFVSTGGALFGDPAVVPVTDDMPAAPESIYGASKLAAERYLALMAKQGGFALSVVRPGNIYGPAQDAHGEAGVVAIFTGRMLRGEPAAIFGDGSQQRDYVYVGDVVDALVRAASGDPATALVGTGRGTTTLEIFEALARLTDYTQPPRFEAERPGDIQRIYLDPSRARAVWGWEPRVGLEEGLGTTVEWFRGQRG